MSEIRFVECCSGCLLHVRTYTLNTVSVKSPPLQNLYKIDPTFYASKNKLPNSQIVDARSIYDVKDFKIKKVI